MSSPRQTDALASLGVFVNDQWEVHRVSAPHDRLRWANMLEYDELVRLASSFGPMPDVEASRSRQCPPQARVSTPPKFPRLTPFLFLLLG